MKPPPSTKNIKVLHIISGLNVGGAEVMLHKLITHFQHNPDITMKVLSLGAIGAIGKKIQNQGTQVIPLNLSMRNFIPAFIKLYRLIKVEKPNIVQCWMYRADLIGGIAAYILRTKCILWSIRQSDTGTRQPLKTRLVIRICALLAKYIPTQVISNAHYSAKKHTQIGYPNNKISIIPNGFNIKPYSRDNSTVAINKEKCGFNANDFIVGIIARFTPEKDHSSFLHAASFAKNSIPNIKFALVGRGIDKNNSALTTLISKLKLWPYIYLIDEVDNTSTYFQAFDVAVLSSYAEGFPNVVGESMLNGCPMVATDVSDIPVILANYGIIVPSKNPRRISEAVIKYYNMSSTERSRIAKLAYQHLVANYSMQKVVQQFLKLYTSNTNI